MVTVAVIADVMLMMAVAVIDDVMLMQASFVVSTESPNCLAVLATHRKLLNPSLGHPGIPMPFGRGPHDGVTIALCEGLNSLSFTAQGSVPKGSRVVGGGKVRKVVTVK